jgi:diphosphomevalonate decarboxylase
MEEITRRKEAARSVLPISWGPFAEEATASAPVNIALAKYWGKRDEELHLPVTDSFSVALDLPTITTVRQALFFDEITLNSTPVPEDSAFYKRCVQFLDLFRPTPSFAFSITTTNTVPTSAGLASSASGFAALTMALNTYFGWNLNHQKLSYLSRLGSGSACRSIYSGFVHWQKGSSPDGKDSYAIPFDDWWSELNLAILMLSSKEKPLSSREAMRLSVETSPVYSLWPDQVENDTKAIMSGIKERDFSAFGQAVERNALMMHATMLTATPAICYWLEETVTSMNMVWQARKNGIEVYFTMDAGPNIKLLFLTQDAQSVLNYFPKARAVSLLPP